MLCESLLHVLVEEGVLSKAKAIEAIETVAELTREMADGNPAVEAHIAADLIKSIAELRIEGLTLFRSLAARASPLVGPPAAASQRVEIVHDFRWRRAELEVIRGKPGNGLQPRDIPQSEPPLPQRDQLLASECL